MRRSPRQHGRALLLTFAPMLAATSPGVATVPRPALVDSLSNTGDWIAADSLAHRGLSSAPSEEHAAWLLRAARARLDLGAVSEADSLLRAARTTEVATSLPALRLRARIATELRQFDEAEDAARACLAHAGSDGVDRARVAALHLARDRLDEAAKVLHEPAGSGPEGGEERAALDEVRASVAVARGEWDRADSLFAVALSARERSTRSDHPSVLRALRGLADVRQRRGDFETAGELHRRALRVVERAGGADHPALAGIHNDLGVMLRRAGDYAGAIEEYRESLRLRRARAGADDAEAALTMVNLSAVLEAVGESAEGIELLRRAVRMLEAVHGERHSRTAWALSHLAQRERGQGNVQRAEALFARCLSIARELYGESHPDVASYLLGMAQCRMDEGRLEEARAAYAEAAGIARETMGDGNPDVARYDRELGVVLVQLGRLDEGRAVLERAVAELERTLSPTHPAIVRALSGLTVAALAERRYDDASALAARRLAIAEKRFGESGLRGSLVMATAVAVATGRFDDAMAAGTRGARSALASQDDVIAKLTEREALEHAAVHRRQISVLLAALATHVDPPESTLARVFPLVARGHGRILDRLAERRQLIEIQSASPQLDALGAAYREAVDRLAKKAARGARGDPEGFAVAMDTLRMAKENAERDLAAASERFRRSIERQERERAVDVTTLTGALPAGGELVHFVRFPVFAIGTPQWRPGAPSLTAALFAGGQERYGVFRLWVDPTGRPRIDFRDLGEADVIDGLVTELRRAVEAPRGRAPSARQEAEWRAASRSLHRVIWEPVAAAPVVFVVPVAALHGVDFHALLEESGVPVIERSHVHLVSSAGDLLRPPAPGASTRALVVGDPEVEGVPDLCGDGSQPRPRLPAAADEARRVARLLGADGSPVTLLVGTDATERATRDAAGNCAVLHVATHGFFCTGDGGGGGTGIDGTLAADPLLQCGLVLGPGEEEDGLWTAQEIVTCDLAGLDCVVLTACDSGLGSLAPGEGLLGLRRAFEMAGARTVVMALGRVSDSATRGLVTRFHELRLEGISASEALREAQRERLAESRRRGRLHPSRWGGFVVEGDWR